MILLFCLQPFYTFFSTLTLIDFLTIMPSYKLLFFCSCKGYREVSRQAGVEFEDIHVAGIFQKLIFWLAVWLKVTYADFVLYNVMEWVKNRPCSEALDSFPAIQKT